MSGRFGREKGKRGEREIAGIIRELTGWEVKRRVRNLLGESDLEGVPGWSVEVKNQATLAVPAWWRQATQQAAFSKQYPVLFYKVPRKGWRARWPLSILVDAPAAGDWLDITMTCDTSIEAWAVVAREVQ